MNPTITLIIQAGYDGGRVIFESAVDEYGHPDTRLVLGGDVEQASKYVAERIAKMDDAPHAKNEEPRQIEPPVKIRVRRKPEPLSIDLDALGTELVEGSGDE